MKLEEYKYRGARALVLLHEKEMKKFWATWKRANEQRVTLPETEDRAYQSMTHLLRHVFGAARGYMVWICEKLKLPDPEIPPVPELESLEAAAEEYLNSLLARWRLPLKAVSQKACDLGEYESRWKVKYCIDAMLEHAVMHPVRHEFQLAELMNSG